MKVSGSRLNGVLIIEPDVYTDNRGSFQELWHNQRYADARIPVNFVQDNISVSQKGVVRGLHYQLPRPQGKLVTVLSGEIFDVAVDIRRASATFGEWIAVNLSFENRKQIYVPEGYAHGFMALEDDTVVLYKCTDYYVSAAARGIRYDDAAIGIEWPPIRTILSEADAGAPSLGSIPEECLFS